MTGIADSVLPMVWTPAGARGQAEIDAGHARTAALHRDALLADAARFPAAFRALRRHLTGQFALEERLMALRGFPPRRIHAAEHAAVLAACGRFPADDARAGREFLALRFGPWFRHHLATMDDATARFLNGEGFAGCAILCGGLPRASLHPVCGCGVPVGGRAAAAAEGASVARIAGGAA